MKAIQTARRAAWTRDELARDTRWIVELDGPARAALLAAVRRAHVPGKPLLDYDRSAFDLAAVQPALDRALDEAKHGRGIALLRGLPRESVSVTEFELMTWALGTYIGVARPQNRTTSYITAVRNEGTDYRSPTGRGYSSNAELDFHTDNADLIVLTCYNDARRGGESMCTSSIAIHNRIAQEDPELGALLYEDFHFSRQGEQVNEELAVIRCPIFGVSDGRLFTRWVRNRLEMAQRINGVPALSERQRAALDLLDRTARAPDLMFEMRLEPGDIQILNTHVTLHSRTAFEDHDDPALRRHLFRLWLAPPDSLPLPKAWREAYRLSLEPGAIRGGQRGTEYNDRCADFEQRQAACLGMKAGGAVTTA